MRSNQLQHRFVEFIPERLEEGVIYVSMEYLTVTHLCCCGCRQEVSITLSPTDWRLIYDGKTVSLEPSIGSWSLPCKSHYFITRNHVIWAQKWSKFEVNEGRRCDTERKFKYRENELKVEPKIPLPDVAETPKVVNNNKLFAWLMKWWR